MIKSIVLINRREGKGRAKVEMGIIQYVLWYNSPMRYGNYNHPLVVGYRGLSRNCGDHR